MRICGVDVGIRNTRLAVIELGRLIYLGEPGNLQCGVCAVDAPLTYGVPFRDCDREIMRMGIPIMPLNLPFMRQIHERALALIPTLACDEVFEVYPYATRRILGFAFDKRSKRGRKAIFDALSKYLNMKLERIPDEHELDAITAALTALLYLEGRGRFLGRKCRILIPDYDVI